MSKEEYSPCEECGKELCMNKLPTWNNNTNEFDSFYMKSCYDCLITYCSEGSEWKRMYPAKAGEGLQSDEDLSHYCEKCQKPIPPKDYFCTCNDDCSMCKGGMYEVCKYFKSEAYKKALKTLKENKAQKEKYKS